MSDNREEMSESIIDIICNNPYRVLGVYANALEKTIKRNNAQIGVFLKEKKPFSVSLDLSHILPPISRTIDSVAKAYSQLQSLRQRLYFAQFWFIRATPEDEKAFKSLKSGEIELASAIWQNRDDVSSLQNRMLCALIMQNNQLALKESEKIYLHHSLDFAKLIVSSGLSLEELGLVLELRKSFFQQLRSQLTVAKSTHQTPVEASQRETDSTQRAQKSAQTRQEMRAQIESILRASSFDADPFTPSEYIYYACKPLLEGIQQKASGKDTEYLKLSTQVGEAILNKEIRAISSRIKSREEALSSSSEADRTRKKTIFAHGWAVMDLIDTLDLTSSDTKQRYESSKAEILEICQQLEVNEPDKLSESVKSRS